MHRNQRNCVFCGIVRENGPNEITYKDDTLTAFADINPSAKSHQLLVPSEHIGTVLDLVPAHHLDLLKKMRAISSEMLQHVPVQDRVVGFHIPPFNSMPHLHLHVLQKPFLNAWRMAKYPKGGARWFVELDTLIDSMERKLAVDPLGTWDRSWLS
ncbi:hypothetical protein HDV03_003034 [Kappamyces sp. JEL0829]|nr:hypothetical protein HDV03_003034 [Kappamyces sp. JEL0829]